MGHHNQKPVKPMFVARIYEYLDYFRWLSSLNAQNYGKTEALADSMATKWRKNVDMHAKNIAGLQNFSLK